MSFSDPRHGPAEISFFSQIITRPWTRASLGVPPSHFRWYTFCLPRGWPGWVSTGGCLNTKVEQTARRKPVNGHPSQY